MRWPFHPGQPFWSGFTAFCANETALFALDKLDVITTKHFALSLFSSSFVGGVVYGRSKVDEIRKRTAEEKEKTIRSELRP